MSLHRWNIYEISAETSPLVKVKLRGRIRKFGVQEGVNILTENSTDTPGNVRFALSTDESPAAVVAFLASIIPDSKVELIKSDVVNPVLSKLQVNVEERYEI